MTPADGSTPPRSLLLGVSLKMYFGHHRTLQWCAEVAEKAAGHPLLASGAATLAVFPSFPALAQVAGILEHTPVRLGAQDLFWEDHGPFTGAVGGPYLVEVGCGFVEIGHAERRRHFGETEGTLARKLGAALRNGLTPVLCVGEHAPGGASAAARTCVEQVRAVVGPHLGNAAPVPLVVAYEPDWAIGADRPASVDHIRTVGRALKDWLAAHPELSRSRVIYGGSAGPGLLSEVDDAADGLFLGRSVHEAGALVTVLDEGARLLASR